MSDFISREDFKGYTEVETRRGGKRYLATLPDGRVQHYMVTIGEYAWFSLRSGENMIMINRPVRYFTKRGARKVAWKKYWKMTHRNGLRVVG